jgi:hypothetical protein
MEAIKKGLTRPETLMQSRNAPRKCLRPTSTLCACGTIDSTSLRIVKMRNGNENFHFNHGEQEELKRQKMKMPTLTKISWLILKTL